MEKKTALYQKHVEAGGKIVPFAGYLMPVQYPTGVIAEHNAVRKAAGLFDVSHMGEVLLSGGGAEWFVQYLLSNNMMDMKIGDCRYSPMCNEQGGVVDDLIVYRQASDVFLLVVNAANREKDVAWMKQHLSGNVLLRDVSDSFAEFALQGPNALPILKKLVPEENLPQDYYTFKENVAIGGALCIVSRTGYTGEDGYEIYCEAGKAEMIWDLLLNAGKEDGLIPCGLGARDTLRLEAGMPLYGHEMDDTITPKEAGLGMFVKMDKPNFIGKDALLAKGEPTRRRTALKMTGRGIAREGAEVFIGDEKIGYVTSGTQLPFVGYAGAMAMLGAAHREIGTKVEVDVRGRRVEAEVVKPPFYRRAK